MLAPSFCVTSRLKPFIQRALSRVFSWGRPSTRPKMLSNVAMVSPKTIRGTPSSAHLANQGLSPDEIRSHVLNIFFAARTSTVSLPASVFRLLAEDSHVQTRLQQEKELRNKLEGRPTYEEVRSLTYLNCVIFKTLRLCLRVPRTIRGAARDTMLPVGEGPDGTDLAWNVWPEGVAKEAT
ncbi:hypothetical protein GGR56DRAFT_317696 [Xylariaceae sp. FL0804]|nr:hypothetical protein GGR56DRAFT_317696 [Xylariaceae sp. FL0804]